jgi:hypothetical protein
LLAFCEFGNSEMFSFILLICNHVIIELPEVVDHCLFDSPNKFNQLEIGFLKTRLFPITFNPECENLAQVLKLGKEIRQSVGYDKIRFGFGLAKENYQWEFRPLNLYKLQIAVLSG